MINMTIDFFQKYTIEDIIIAIIVIVSVAKTIATFVDWIKGKISNGKQEAVQQNQEMQNTLNNFSACKHNIEKIVRQMDSLTDKVDTIDEAVKDLTDSDKEDIKAYITNRYRYFVKDVGHIDEFTLDCIEKRYIRYKKEGGNSFIDELMTQIRALPRDTGISDPS